MTLFQSILNMIVLFLVNYWALVVIGLAEMDIYVRFFRVNKNTDDVDLMSRYVYKEMNRRK
jgi:hypothetical protein